MYMLTEDEMVCAYAGMCACMISGYVMDVMYPDMMNNKMKKKMLSGT